MSSCEQVLVDLIHDLAQPLGNIETSAYCLDLTLDHQNARAQEYLSVIQRQLERANGLLSAAAAELSRARTGSFELTGVSH